MLLRQQSQVGAVPHRKLLLVVPRLPLKRKLFCTAFVVFGESASLRADDLQQLIPALRNDKALGQLQSEITRGKAGLAAQFGCGGRLVEAPLEGSPLGDQVVSRIFCEARHANHERLF